MSLDDPVRDVGHSAVMSSRTPIMDDETLAQVEQEKPEELYSSGFSCGDFLMRAGYQSEDKIIL
jgi:hypothetical protein